MMTLRSPGMHQRRRRPNHRVDAAYRAAWLFVIFVVVVVGVVCSVFS